jgi:hypothetical protein
MFYLEDVKVNAGIIAKGNWIDIRAFKISFIPVNLLISLKYAKENVGAIAIERVNKTLEKGFKK